MTARPEFEEQLETLYRADEAGYFYEEYAALTSQNYPSPIEPATRARRAFFNKTVRAANRETRAKARATFQAAIVAKVSGLLGVSSSDAAHLVEAANSRNRALGWNGKRP